VKTLSDESATYGQVETEAGKDAKQYIDQLQGNEEIDENLANIIESLWKDPGIQKTYASRSSYQLIDSCQYFMERILEYGRKDFIPTEQDIFRTRVRTTGILENSFTIEGNKFLMVDVGGQRNERKKWIHCFEGVTAVLFVAAISSYDQMMYEDRKTNCMEDTLKVFDEIINYRVFAKTNIILFLNKRDIFMEKIKRVSLKVCFKDYDGAEGDAEAAVGYLTKKFEALNKNHKEHAIYPHVTCATDTDNVSHVFNSVRDIVIRQNVLSSGLLLQ